MSFSIDLSGIPNDFRARVTRALDETLAAGLLIRLAPAVIGRDTAEEASRQGWTVAESQSFGRVAAVLAAEIAADRIADVIADSLQGMTTRHLDLSSDEQGLLIAIQLGEGLDLRRVRPIPDGYRLVQSLSDKGLVRVEQGEISTTDAGFAVVVSLSRRRADAAGGPR